MLFKKFLNLINGKRKMSHIWELVLLQPIEYDDIFSVPEDKYLKIPSSCFNEELEVLGELEI